MSNYAYKKVKLSSRQQYFCDEVAKRHDGATDHIGVDFGGWIAHNQIIAALRKKGVMTSEPNKRYTLVVGEPLVVADPKFGKPYIKIKKECLTVFTGHEFETQDLQIYLDPRGDCKFKIILPYDISNLINVGDRATTHSFDDKSFMVVQGKSAEEVVGNLQNMVTEYKLASAGELKDVLWVGFEQHIATAEAMHWKTSFGFQYIRLITNGDTYFMLDKNAYMKEVKWYDLKNEGVIIPWTQDREDKLDGLKQRIIMAADQLREILYGDKLLEELDNGVLSIPLMHN